MSEEYPYPDISIEHVKAAAKRIEPYAHLTPVMTSSTLDSLAGRQLFFKCEQFQKVGAFKFRGACNSVIKLSEEDAQKGVVTHSSGNHAQALALAAKTRGIPAYIVIPSNAPSVKKEATAGYGANIILCEPNLKSREETSARVASETGATFIHPFNNEDVIAGQGTVALEFMNQVKDLDAIIVPVGGGGLLSGVSIAAKGINPDIKIYAAEPKGADDAHRSTTTGVLVTSHVPNTVADGLLTCMSPLTWSIIKRNVEKVFVVSEEEIKAAMKLVWERMKLVIEPSSAVTVAVALSEQFKKVEGKRVGIVLGGGNVDITTWRFD